MLNSIDTPIGDLDDFVEGHERGLQGGQLHQQLDRTLEVLLQLGELLATAGETSQLVCV